MRAVLAVCVFVLDVWALTGVTALPSRRERVRWIALVVGVPVVGVALWVRRKRAEARA